MIKTIFIFLISISFLNAEYKIEKNKNLFLVKTDTTFSQTLLSLKDELIFNGFSIVYELDMAKSTNGVAEILETKGILEKGINIGICKSSFTFEMVSENFHNINYCPLSISVYAIDKKDTFIAFKYYKSVKFGDKIADKINDTLETLILESLD